MVSTLEEPTDIGNMLKMRGVGVCSKVREAFKHLSTNGSWFEDTSHADR